jgi:hypothetical protein
MAVLPNEDPAELQALRDAWFAHDRPTDPAHVLAIENVVLATWRMRRCARHEAAVLARQVRGAREAFDLAALLEAEALGRRLLLDPLGRLPFVPPRPPKPPAHLRPIKPPPPDPTPWSDPEDDPALLVAQLNATAAGADWLLRQWGELSAMLEEAGYWDIGGLMFATRLLGRRPQDAAEDLAAVRVLAACAAAHPDPERLRADWVDQHEWFDDDEAFARAAPRSAARGGRAGGLAALRALVAAEVARLEERKRTVLDPRAALDREEAGDRALFDPSPQAVLLRRYETACERECHKALAELLKLRKERGDAPDPAPPAAAAGAPVRNEPVAETAGGQGLRADGPVESPPTTAARPVNPVSDLDMRQSSPLPARRRPVRPPS